VCDDDGIRRSTASGIGGTMRPCSFTPST
jgi:hypothetical protein